MKFGNLLGKEIKGLLTPMAIFSMLFSCILLIAMGQAFGGAVSDIADNSVVNICDLDKTDYTADMLQRLPDYGTEANIVELQSDDYSSELERLGIESIVIIPKGFTKSIFEDKAPASLEYAARLSTGMSGMSGAGNGSTAISAVEACVFDDVLLKEYGLSEEDIALIKEPVKLIEFTVMNGKSAEISSNTLFVLLMSTSLIVPMAVFFLLLMGSQMIMSAISTEKIDKTLETLLSTPVSRITILAAKMTAALIVALLNSVTMIIGMIGYMAGMMGSGISTDTSLTGDTSMSNVSELTGALSALGIDMGAGTILLVGLQLFVSVMIGLGISLILGALCEDAQSVSAVIMPLMFVVMIPFFVTMFTDVNSLNTVFKIILYIIPFTHSYMALTNLIMGNTALFWGGFVYQIIFFIICMTGAVRLFTTDRIFTMSGKFGKKK